MDYKLRLKIGLLLTALITAVIISNLLPPISVAVIFFLASLALTYYVATDAVKEQKIKEMALVIKGLESVSKTRDKAELIQVLALWVKKLVGGEDYYIAWPDENVDDKWQELLDKYHDTKESLLISDEASLPVGNKAALYIPLIINGEPVVRLILAADKENQLKAYHVKLVEPLIKMAQNMLEHWDKAAAEKMRESEILLSLNRAREAYSPNMIGHGERVAKLSVKMGKILGLKPRELEDLEYGALLHDIGQVAVLYKNLNLATEEERLGFIAHPLLGFELIPSSEEYREIRNAILYHHEYYDGTGYPEGLSYTDIPLLARIVAVADAYDALAYLAKEEERKDQVEAFNLIKRNTGSKFDPLVVVALEELLEAGELG